MLARRARIPWVCHICRSHLIENKHIEGRLFSVAASLREDAGRDERLARTRNIGIIAHIDAGKTTTTERMLYYSGFTRRIGDVDDGSTVTDFLPAERARGITIQSAAITFHWPPLPTAQETTSPKSSESSYTINLIDTPGHADFTFEVIRSLRILDGAICILDGVAGVEAQTEKVWHQANGYQIPRIIYVNKLDRDGAAFNRTVMEIASRLHTWPALCQIPWWSNGRFIGVGDVVNYRALSWEAGSDGTAFKRFEIDEIRNVDSKFADELLKARTALIELLTEHDEYLVESFLESNEDWEGFSASTIQDSIRRILLSGGQEVTPVYAGASFRNIGVQPLLDSIKSLLPSPSETVDPAVSLGKDVMSLRQLLSGNVVSSRASSSSKPAPRTKSSPGQGNISNVTGLALAFKVVNDPKRGVLVYVRVYSGSIPRNSLLYNINLALSERANRLLRMYASDAVEVPAIEEGQIGVIAGLKHARTGDTLLIYQGMNTKTGPPEPINTLQLQPIAVPPPLFFTSVEPNSLAEQKGLEEAIAILLREDPSLAVSTDPESGQTHLAGMGELHLEIARDRLINDFKVRARTGKIEIGYREVVPEAGGPCTERFDKEIAGKKASAEAVASVALIDESTNDDDSDNRSQTIALSDNNILTIQHPYLHPSGRPTPSQPSLPADLPFRTIKASFQSGVLAALARGPSHALPIHSTHITITFDQSTSLTSTTTPSALVSAARLATTAALKAATRRQPSALMEPVMLATIAVTESTLGAVVHDLTSARGAQVLSLDADADDDDAETAGARTELERKRLTSSQLSRVYAPPDPFGGSGGGVDAGVVTDQIRQIKARVPLKEMVGYLKVLRSLTGGRGTFVMSVDRFERMGAQRVKVALAEMRGDFV